MLTTSHSKSPYPFLHRGEAICMGAAVGNLRFKIYLPPFEKGESALRAWGIFRESAFCWVLSGRVWWQ